MTLVLRGSRSFATVTLVIAASVWCHFSNSVALAQKGVEQKVFAVWRQRAEDTAKLSVVLSLETKTQAGFYLHQPERSPDHVPYPIEDATALHRYTLLLDSPDRHRIESEGPRFQSEAFAGIKAKRIDVQTESDAKSLLTTAAFDDLPQISRVTLTKRFESDKTFELLPLYLVYRPFDNDLNDEHPLLRFKYVREDSISGKDVVVFGLDEESRRQECWLDAADKYLLLRYRQSHKKGEAWLPFIEMDLKYGEPQRNGIPSLIAWQTVYTISRPPLGQLQNGMRGTIEAFKILDSIDKSKFDLKLPPVHVMGDRVNNKDYLQLENGERVPIKYSLDESASRTVHRLLQGVKK